ncbi:uncharacterized protein LOC119440735 [Dermacentor silvarum]|uniref:uncharacterized protein LOC119440735 n=1 Tax=Dermacentor silvarum TaxID=543639 RepID=UPI001898D464|nr:uncharacterized protein LOC119440735 [Dermacentor silvarum]
MDFRLTQPRLSPEHQALFKRIGLCLLALVVVMTTVLLVLTGSHYGLPLRLRGGASAAERFTRRAAQLCNSTSCRLTATMLKETLDQRGSPCDNLYAYVCSGWLQEPAFTTTHDRQMALLTWHARSGLRHIAQRANTTDHVGKRLKMPPNQQPSTTNNQQGALGRGQVTSSSAKAAVLYSRCLEASMEHRADALATFLQDLGLGTFIADVEYPVELAIKLDLYYDLKTLFDLHRHPTWRRKDGRPLLSMGRRTDLEPWRRERNRMRRDLTYLKFVKRYVNALLVQVNNSTDTNENVHQAGNVDLIAHRITTTEEVVLAMTALIPDDDPSHYHAIVTLMPRSSSSLWPPSLAINNISEVAVGHPAVLGYLDFLTYDLPPSGATAYVTWELVRQLVPLADQKFSQSTAEATCFEAVFRLMPYPSVIPGMEALDLFNGWREAEVTFRGVAEALVSFMKVHGVAVRAQAATFTLPLPTTRDLDAFYDDLRVSEDYRERSFLEDYLIALSQIRSKELLSVAYGDSVSYYPPPPPGSPQVQVTATAKRRVPLTWLFPPRFGADAPPSLNYGGFALQVVTALLRGASLNRSWLECLQTLEPRVAFAREGDNSDWARLVLATEVVAAFVDRHSEVGQPLVLPGLEFLSEDMLFFVSACAGSCAKGDPSAPYRCNLIAKSSPKFAQAFGCWRGSRMSPPNLCLYSNRTR